MAVAFSILRWESTFLIEKPFSVDRIGGGEIVYVHDVGAIPVILRCDHGGDRTRKRFHER